MRRRKLKYIHGYVANIGGTKIVIKPHHIGLDAHTRAKQRAKERRCT